MARDPRRGHRRPGRGRDLASALEVCASVVERVPVVLMVYANMVLAKGGAVEFARRAAGAGAAGAIVPDLPLGESEEVRDAFAAAGPGTGAAGRADHPRRAPRRDLCRGPGVRLCRLQGRDHGRAGRTASGLAELVAATKADSEVPVAVGFGIGTPRQAAQVGEVADGVIIGSRLVRAAGEAGSAEAAADAVGAFLRETRDALAR